MIYKTKGHKQGETAHSAAPSVVSSDFSDSGQLYITAVAVSL